MTQTERELLEALKEYVRNDDASLPLNGINTKARVAIAKAEAEQAERVEPVPVAWYIEEHGDIVDLEWDTNKPNTTCGDWKPLYTEQIAATVSKPLTDEYKRGFIDGMKEAPTGECWIRAIDEAMVGAHLGIADMGDDYGTAKKKLNDLICWSVEVDKELSKPPAEVSEPLTDSYVQKVPDKCDRITWRNKYYHLPIEKPAAAVNEPWQPIETAMPEPMVPVLVYNGKQVFIKVVMIKIWV